MKFLWKGRKVYWHRRRMVVVRRIGKEYVVIANDNNRKMQITVKRSDITLD